MKGWIVNRQYDWWRAEAEAEGLMNHSDEGLMLETSAVLPFAVANLRFQLRC